MAQTIKIKRSTSTSAPGSLVAGELAYSDASDKLFIGQPSDNAVTAIGGKVYVDMLDHTAGTLTASSAILVDASSKIDQLKTANLTIGANSITSGSGDVDIVAAANLDIDAGTIDLSTQATQFSIVDNSATALTIAESSTVYLTLDTTNAAEKIIVGKSLDLNGNELILDADADTSIHVSTDDQIDFKVAGSDELVLGTSHLQPATNQGLELGGSSNTWAALYVDNLKLDGNTISSTNSNGNVIFAPNGTGVTVFDGNASTGGVSISDGLIEIRTGTGSVAAVDFYCEVNNAHKVRLQSPAHANYSGNVTVTLPTTSTTLIGANTTDTLTNKTLTSPDINTPDIDGGTVDGAVIGGNSAAAGTFTAIVGTSLAVDNVSVDANTISTTNSNGDLVLSPNGTGSVTVPSGYKNRSGFGANSLVSKEYVDAVKVGLDFKDSVRVATTATVTVSGPGAAIDGVTLSSGDRVLLKNQSTGSENGIYVFNGAASALTRATDADANAEVTSGLFTFVEEGTVNADSGFVLTTDGSITVGSTSLAFAQFSGAGQIVAGDGMTKSGNQLDVNDDNITLEINSDAVRIKGISATAVGDLLVGQAGNAGYTRLVKPSGNATAHDYILSMNTSGAAQWSNTLDGGTF